MSSTPITIAPLTATDLERVAALEVQLFAAPRSQAFYQQEVTQNDYAHYWVLHTVLSPPPPGINSGRAAASLVVAYGGYWLLGDEVQLIVIGVDSAHQRRGLAEWLLAEMLLAASRAGAQVMNLEVRASNHAAAALYHKFGFERVGLRKGYYQENGEDAHLLSCFALQTEAIQQSLVQRLSRLRARYQGHTAAYVPGDPGGRPTVV